MPQETIQCSLKDGGLDGVMFVIPSGSIDEG
jgi:hypothetical protein